MTRMMVIGSCLLMFITSAEVARGDEGARDGETQFASVAAQQALERYRVEVEAIERVAAERKELARQRLVNSLRQTQRAEEERGPRYRGMLGSYEDSAGRIPYVLLSVPDGSNVLSKRFWDAMNSGYGVRKPIYRFEARGYVRIPAKGTYRLETGRGYGQVKLNSTSYALRQEKPGQPLFADVELDQGVYEVYYRIGNNGGQMNYSMLRISNGKSGEPLPIFVYESDLKRFLNDLSLGVELTETSGWTPKNNRLE